MRNNVGQTRESVIAATRSALTISAVVLFVALLFAGGCTGRDSGDVQLQDVASIGPETISPSFSSGDVWDERGAADESYGTLSNLPSDVSPKKAAESLLPSAMADPGFMLWWIGEGGGNSAGAPEFRRVRSSVIVTEVVGHATPDRQRSALSWSDLQQNGEYTAFVEGDEDTGGIFSIRVENDRWRYSPNGIAPGGAVVEAMRAARARGELEATALIPSSPISWLAVQYAEGDTAAYPISWVGNFSHRVQGRLLRRGRPFPLDAITATVTVGD